MIASTVVYLELDSIESNQRLRTHNYLQTLLKEQPHNHLTLNILSYYIHTASYFGTFNNGLLLGTIASLTLYTTLGEMT